MVGCFNRFLDGFTLWSFLWFSPLVAAVGLLAVRFAGVFCAACLGFVGLGVLLLFGVSPQRLCCFVLVLSSGSFGCFLSFRLLVLVVVLVVQTLGSCYFSLFVCAASFPLALT